MHWLIKLQEVCSQNSRKMLWKDKWVKWSTLYLNIPAQDRVVLWWLIDIPNLNLLMKASKYGVTIQMKPLWQNFCTVLFTS